MNETNDNSKSGEIFSVHAVVQMDLFSYAILLNEDKTSYVPIVIPPHMRGVLEALLDGEEQTLSFLGIYWSMAKIMEANGSVASKIMIEKVDADDGIVAVSCIDAEERNAIHRLFSRIPIVTWEAPILSLILKCPIVVYENQGEEFSIKIDIRNDDIMNIITTTLNKSEEALGFQQNPEEDDLPSSSEPSGPFGP
jgi:hypothetical protein